MYFAGTGFVYSLKFEDAIDLRPWQERERATACIL